MIKGTWAKNRKNNSRLYMTITSRKPLKLAVASSVLARQHVMMRPFRYTFTMTDEFGIVSGQSDFDLFIPTGRKMTNIHMTRKPRKHRPKKWWAIILKRYGAQLL